MPAAILLTLVAINLGEFSFFSMTSEGGLIWSLVFTAAVIDGTNLNKERSFKAWQTKANARVLNGF